MRTTFLIDDDLYRGVKVLAAQETRTVTSVVEEALQQLLDEHAAKQGTSSGEPFRFKPMGSGGLRPGAADYLLQEALASDDEVERYLKVLARG